MDRSFCPPNFGIIFGNNPLIKLLHGKTPHICMHTLWHEHIARATTECTGIAIERKQHTTWLSQCVPSRVCNSRNLISFLKITDTLLGKERDTLRIYAIMNKDTQRIRKLVKCQDVERNVRQLTKQMFLFCSPSAYVIENQHRKSVCVLIPCVTVDHDTVPMRYNADLVKGGTFYPFPASIGRLHCIRPEWGGKRGGEVWSELCALI